MDNMRFAPIDETDLQAVAKHADRHGRVLPIDKHTLAGIAYQDNFTAVVLVNPKSGAVRVGVTKRMPTDANNEKTARHISLTRAAFAEPIFLKEKKSAPKKRRKG